MCFGRVSFSFSSSLLVVCRFVCFFAYYIDVLAHRPWGTQDWRSSHRSRRQSIISVVSQFLESARCAVTQAVV